MPAVSIQGWYFCFTPVGALYSDIGIAMLRVCHNVIVFLHTCPAVWTVGSKSQLLCAVLLCLFELLLAGFRSSTTTVFIGDVHPAGCLLSANFVDGSNLGTLVTLRKCVSCILMVTHFLHPVGQSHLLSLLKLYQSVVSKIKLWFGVQPQKWTCPLGVMWRRVTLIYCVCACVWDV